MKEMTFYTESFGCQMNAYETEVIAALLVERGARSVAAPGEADCIIVNTCSVRDHAERRAIGRLHDLARHRRAVIAVCGCMAQRLGAALFDVSPSIRVLAGSDAYAMLPHAIEQAIASGDRFALLETDDATVYELSPAALPGSVTRYVSITRGCENYCSYCIVPYLRGAVRSRPGSSIVREIAALCDHGAREVTLLGQNVVAYRDGDTDFTALLRAILAGTDIARVRFMTSHPRDVRRDIFDLMAEQPRLCPHIHLPAQSGSDRILAAMNRGYTQSHYLALLDTARTIVPDLAVTSDIIVGFPGETPADFERTLDLVRRAGFDAAFTFKYSPRTGTAAAALADDVPGAEKKERLRLLNDVVQEGRGRILAAQVGTTAEILLDGRVEKGETRFRKGRTPHFRNVLVRDDGFADGDIISVILARLANFTFEGEPAHRP